MLNASPQAPHGGGESDGSAPCCGMSGCPSLWPWPRSCTTAHSARRWPGPGRRISSCTTRRSSGRILLPRRQAQCTFPLTDEEVPAAGSRPDRLSAVSGPQARVQRRTVQQIVDFAPLPTLDDPAPQMVVQLPDVLLCFFRALSPDPEAGYRSAQDLA